MRRCAVAEKTLDLAVHFFFFNDTATTEIYTLSLHDALPIYGGSPHAGRRDRRGGRLHSGGSDRKSTRLNSSHGYISDAVFCLKKKENEQVIVELVLQLAGGVGHRLAARAG